MVLWSNNIIEQKSDVKDNHRVVFHVEYNMDKNNNLFLGETLFPDCPVRNILARVGDKWSLLLMHQMMHHQEPMRFSDLKKAIPDISQKVLTSTLTHIAAINHVTH